MEKDIVGYVHRSLQLSFLIVSRTVVNIIYVVVCTTVCSMDVALRVLSFDFQ